jgi:hypothetical protein
MVECTTCGVELRVYWMCDEITGQWCDYCWPAVFCEDLHGEEYATRVWSDGD